MAQDILREEKLAELALAIRHHDHYYNMSDDNSVWRAGVREREAIKDRLAELFDKQSERCEVYNENAPDGARLTQAWINELKAQGK